MRNKRILAISAIAISASVFMAACSFGGSNPEESVAVSVTPTPVATDRSECTGYYLYIRRQIRSDQPSKRNMGKQDR